MVSVVIPRTLVLVWVRNSFWILPKEQGMGTKKKKNYFILLPSPKKAGEKTRPQVSELKTWNYCNLPIFSATIRAYPFKTHSNWLMFAVFLQLASLTTTYLHSSHLTYSSLLAMLPAGNPAVSRRRYSVTHFLWVFLFVLMSAGEICS